MRDGAVAGGGFPSDRGGVAESNWGWAGFTRALLERGLLAPNNTGKNACATNQYRLGYGVGMEAAHSLHTVRRCCLASSGLANVTSRKP